MPEDLDQARGRGVGGPVVRLLCAIRAEDAIVPRTWQLICPLDIISIWSTPTVSPTPAAQFLIMMIRREGLCPINSGRVSRTPCARSSGGSNARIAGAPNEINCSRARATPTRWHISRIGCHHRDCSLRNRACSGAGLERQRSTLIECQGGVSEKAQPGPAATIPYRCRWLQ